MKILSNLSNSKAAVQDITRIEERKYWTRGLRQAELIIGDKEDALTANKQAKAKAERDLQLLIEIRSYLEKLLRIVKPIPILGHWLDNKVCDLGDQIIAHSKGQNKRDALFRDCQMELDVAIAERSRILEEHPEASLLDYEELQDRHSPVAHFQQKVAYLAPRIWAAQQGLPEAVGVALFETAPEERQQLLAQIQQVQTGFVVSERILDLASRIAELPSHRQDEFFQLLLPENCATITHGRVDE